MSNHKNLLFFNKEGDNLNFNYSNANDRFEGTILFHENSNDTFKTAGLYTLERIPSFEFEYPGEMSLNKFQLFNEYGFDFYAGNYTTQSISKIEPINNDPGFYSKWIYGDFLDKSFPIGTIIRFDSPLLEFTNPLQTYTVVGTKKGAIMIISSVDNSTFETNFYNQYVYDITYVGKSISGVNAIGVYNYINKLYQNNLSTWNEPNFYDKLYKRKKLNVVNSESNNNTLTVTEVDITDNKFFEYYTSTSDLLTTGDLIIEVSTKTDLPKIYDGSLSIKYTAASFSTPALNRISFGGLVPAILKPGTEFKIIGSNNNQNFFTVASIPSFNGNTQQTFYATQSQVLYDNRIYECVQAYTQSFANTTTQFVTPNNNTSYWTNIISYIPVDQQVITESLSSCQLYLTTDKLYFQYGWTQSNEVTLASAAQKYVNDLKTFNVELYYENSNLKADLMYPSKYVEVNFYQTNIGPTYSISKTKETYERLIQVEEPVTKELNYNFSSNFSLNIVFTDLDEYGFKVKLNKQVFEEEIAWVYSGASPDMQRTIDRTLRAWLTRNYISLQKLGIVAELQYIGSFTSPFYNSIRLRTDYPNVEFVLNEVLVGTTANYYIEHSRVLFNDMGSYLSFTINDDTYDQSTIYLTGTYSKYPNIPATLSAWVDEHGDYLNSYGILVSNINNLLKFDIKRTDRRLDYSINTGKSTLPGINDFIITKKIKGNLGVLIASNEVSLSPSSTGTYSFEDAGFATGMAFSVNNTFHTWNNQEYNIQYLDPGVMNLSYQGPFWATNNAICNSSPFITLAFEVGFGQTGCGPIVGPTGASASGGPFATQSFSSAFSLTYNLNTYIPTTYALSSYPGSTNLVDIIYVQLSNSLYAFGDGLVVLDSYLGNVTANVTLPGNTQSIAMRFNGINNYLYCLSKNKVYVVDPLLNTIVTSWTLANNAVDMQINSANGDIYISFSNVARVEIYNLSNILTQTLTTSSSLFPNDATSTGTMVFNEFESRMYIITNSSISSVLRVLGSTRSIQTTFGIPGATGTIFYEPVNESVYVYGSASLWKIDNSVSVAISGVLTSGFEDIIYNNLSGYVNISDSSTSFKALDLTTNNVISDVSVGNYGYLALNQFDGDVYLSSKSTNVIQVINPINGNVVHTESLSAGSGRVIYNPDRKSIWTIQPSINSVLEVEVTLNGVITPEVIGTQIAEDNLYGTLNPDYVPHPDIWLKTKEYLRKPRENFQNDVPVEYYFRWYSDESPEFFMYDFSGTQLTTSGSYSYTGPKPLPNIVLNSKPNKDLTKLDAPEYQQTIFETVTHTLSYIDDEDDISTKPEPLELFLGFRSNEEGALRSILQLYKKEDIFLTYESTSINNSVISFETLDVYGPDKRGIIKLNTNSPYEFNNSGLKEGQLIAIYIKDTINKKNQYISSNNGTIVKIRNVFYKNIIVDFLSTNDYLFQESTVISDYPATGNKTYCRFDIKVIDREIGRFIAYGQTEIEDIRFKTELGNIGKLIAPNEVFIFKEYDILEGGTDWTYLNKKRKEMLMMKHLIYPYIGAYKSIINAINFFGYNDLQLNEYYKNINPQSEKFLKLFKVEIPDIFDNTVEGWTESDFITNNFPNNDYEETNMFNLSYNITDEEGNNVLNYSIDEVIIKLQGLKYWLKRNIIPLTHKILDITGKAYFNNQTQIQHTSYDVQIFNIRQNMTPISFKLNEAYLMPINSGSTVYNCVVDFYTILDKIGADKNPTGLTPPPKPFNGVSLELPDYFDITVRTYKTYKEWYPFTVYDKGDKISYYGRIYESQIDNNKIHNPRKYEGISSWTSGASYSVTSTVEYNRDVFVYSGLGSTASATSSISPVVDTQNWLKITEWKEINYEPVQTIKEFRQVPKIATQSTTSMLPPPNPILPFNFTIDSNIDPFIVIEVTTDNGYGLIYRDKKNYEVRGLKDLREPVSYIDLIGPFNPIEPVLAPTPSVPVIPPPIPLPPASFMYSPSSTNKVFGVGTSPVPTVTTYGLTPSFAISYISFNGYTMSSATAVSIDSQTGKISFNYGIYTSNSLDYGTHSVFVNAITSAGIATASHNIVIPEVPDLDLFDNQTIVSTTRLGNNTATYNGFRTYDINKTKTNFSIETLGSYAYLPYNELPTNPFIFSRRLGINFNYLFATSLANVSSVAVNTIYRYGIDNNLTMDINTSTYSYWTFNSPTPQFASSAGGTYKSMAIAPERKIDPNKVLVSWGGGRIYSVDLSTNMYGTIQNTQITELLNLPNTSSVIGSIMFSSGVNTDIYSVTSLLSIENRIYAICVSGFNSVFVEIIDNGFSSVTRYQRIRTVHLSGNWGSNIGNPYIIKQVTGGGASTEFPTLSGTSTYTADSIISIGDSRTIGNNINNLYIYFRNPQVPPPISTFIADTPLLYKLDLETSPASLKLVRDVIQLGVSPTNISPFLNI